MANDPEPKLAKQCFQDHKPYQSNKEHQWTSIYTRTKAKVHDPNLKTRQFPPIAFPFDFILHPAEVILVRLIFVEHFFGGCFYLSNKIFVYKFSYLLIKKIYILRI